MMTYLVLKRLADITLSAGALVALAPLMILIALIICLETPGNPFFGHGRIGKNNMHFRMWKFRSMVQNASSQGPEWTDAGDPRITRVGNILRHTSLDELPQLWNVLMGNMSLVGPRPATPSQLEMYGTDAWNIRHRVRPGITGLAQVSGRSNCTNEEKIAYDVTYAREVNFRMDLRILLRTVVMVLSRQGTN